MSQKEHLRNLGVLAILVAVLLLVPPTFSIYIRTFSMFMMLYVVLALSWNIISGYTGYISLGHVIFYGVGSYVTGVLMVKYGWHWIPTIFAGGVIGGVFAIFIGYPVLRLKGPYFAIAMLGASEGTRVIVSVWDSVTGGGDGISFPNIENSWETFHAMLALMVLTIVVSYWVGHSRFGIRLNAIREDEVAAESLGINTTFYKMSALVLSGIFPAMGGGIASYKVLYIEPDSEFFILVTIYMKLFALFGGKGTVLGPIIGAIILYSIQEITWIKFPTAHLIAFGIFIILVARFMPRGLMGVAVDRGWVRKGMVH